MCTVTGEKFTSTDEIHCHHKLPRLQGSTDNYDNLILVTGTVHKLIHATKTDTIRHTCKPVNLTLKSLMCYANSLEINNSFTLQQVKSIFFVQFLSFLFPFWQKVYLIQYII